MAKQLLQFGDKSTADIMLRLLDSEGADYEENPLYLHSHVLRKCDFYEAMLSERWSVDKQRPLQITVTSTHSLENYIKCIRLIYSSQATIKRFCFPSVDDALAILPVAAQLLFHECMHECMRYLNAVRWTPVQEAQLRALLLSLQLSTVPTELAARLRMNVDKSDLNEGLQFLEESLEEILSVIWNDSYYRNIVAECIVGCFVPTGASSIVADTCARLLVKACSFHVQLIKRDKYRAISIKNYTGNAYANLSWLVDLIRRCDGELFGTVFKMLSEDVSLPEAVNRLMEQDEGVKHIMDILINRFLICLGNGELITPASIRVSFLSNWLNTMMRFVKIQRDMDTMETGLVDVAETLPLSEQRRVFKIWKEAAFKNQYDVRRRVRPIEWWAKKLHDAFASKN